MTYTPGVLAQNVTVPADTYPFYTLLEVGDSPTEAQAATLTNPEVWATLPSTGLPVYTPTLDDVAKYSGLTKTVIDQINRDTSGLLKAALRDALGIV